MLGWVVGRRLAAFERNFDYDLSYARDIYSTSPRAFWRFSKIFGMAEHREEAPVEAWYAVKVAATLSEDCGPCTQLVVTMAERAGVSAEALRAILAGDPRAMPRDAALGFRFAQSVLTRELEEGDRVRREVVERWGRKALVSLALAVATARVFPAVKYALGYGHACVRLRVAGSDAPFSRQATA